MRLIGEQCRADLKQTLVVDNRPGRRSAKCARPQGGSTAVIRRLNEGISKILSQPDIRDRMTAVELEFVPNTPAQATARLQSEGVKSKEVITRLGLRVD